MSSSIAAQSQAGRSQFTGPARDAKPISVLVVDDSAFMRKMISEMIASDPALKLAGTARDGHDALAQIERADPRVVTLDIEMPQLDGFAVLRALANRDLEKPPVSVVMLSSLTQQGADATLQCLNMGAVDFVAKPSGAISLDIDSVQDDLLDKIKIAGHARSVAALAQRRKSSPQAAAHPPIFGIPGGCATNRPLGAPTEERTLAAAGEGVLVIGASTGGPRALQELFSSLRAERIGVPIVIVQHMPPRFTTSLAAHLQAVAPRLIVKEAEEGDRLRAGAALIAPGGKHLVFTSGGEARLTDEPPIHGVRPAVDVTMTSLAQLYKGKTCGVVLTGMGRDGARAMKLVRDLGGRTLAEDESSCVVYGMPKAAVEIGGVERVVCLPDMAEAVMRMVESAN